MLGDAMYVALILAKLGSTRSTYTSDVRQRGHQDHQGLPRLQYGRLPSLSSASLAKVLATINQVASVATYDSGLEQRGCKKFGLNHYIDG